MTPQRTQSLLARAVTDSTLLIAIAVSPIPGCDRPGNGAHGGSAPADSSPAPITLSKRTLDSGLVIEDLVEGAGEECPPGATVLVNFHASIEDGAEFDSSNRRKAPLSIPLARPSTIEGLREGIPGMRIGGKRRLTIPWLLAYGEEGREPIPPRTNLVFEIELLKVTTETPAPTRP